MLRAAPSAGSGATSVARGGGALPGSGGTLGAPWFSLGAPWFSLGAPRRVSRQCRWRERYLAAKAAAEAALAEAGTHPDQTTQRPALFTPYTACLWVKPDPASDSS